MLAYILDFRLVKHSEYKEKGYFEKQFSLLLLIFSSNMQIIIRNLVYINRKAYIQLSYILLIAGLLLSFSSHSQTFFTPEGDFVEIKMKLPEVETDVRYAGTNNFVGRSIPGYNAEKIILSKPAADMLHKSIQHLNRKGYGVVIYDAYRPQKAVDYFRKWSRDMGDTIAKPDFYPDIAKKDLFQLGYIASKSGHSRGSTIDLSLTDLKTGREIDMGGIYDFFDESSSPHSDKITVHQQINRNILREAMLMHGFKPLHTEWWHFTLKDEPYPETYFDFNVE